MKAVSYRVDNSHLKYDNLSGSLAIEKGGANFSIRKS